MPCFTIQTSTIELGKVHPKTLADALEKMGFTVIMSGKKFTFSGVHNVTGQRHSGSFDGKLEVRAGVGQPLEVNAIKRAYSAVVVEGNAKRMGWTLKKTGANTYAAIKR